MDNKLDVLLNMVHFNAERFFTLSFLTNVDPICKPYNLCPKGKSLELDNFIPALVCFYFQDESLSMDGDQVTIIPSQPPRLSIVRNSEIIDFYQQCIDQDYHSLCKLRDYLLWYLPMCKIHSQADLSAEENREIFHKQALEAIKLFNSTSDVSVLLEYLLKLPHYVRETFYYNCYYM